jgi:hypothetical protein
LFQVHLILRWGVFYRTFLKRVKENMFEKSNSKYLGFIEFALALLCELRTIRIVQEKRQETFVVIVVGRHKSMPCLLAHNYLFSKPTGHSLTCGFCLLRNRANCRQLKVDELQKLQRINNEL